MELGIAAHISQFYFFYHIFRRKNDDLPVGQDLEQEEKSSMFKPI